MHFVQYRPYLPVAIAIVGGFALLGGTAASAQSEEDLAKQLSNPVGI